MRIVYLHPPYGDDFVRAARWAAKSRGRVQRHPELALIQIAVLEAAGHDCTFIEGAARNLTRQQVAQVIDESRPELAIVHTTTPSIDNDISYAKLAKELTGCTTVLVGAHVTAEPEDTFARANGTVDIIARGEVDYALRDIADGLPVDTIGGLSYLKHETVTHNPGRPPLDVNELPFPSWRHIDPSWYHDAGKLYPFLTLYTGRGCFGTCTFCRETANVHGSRMRMRTATKVVDEMEHDLTLFPHLREIMFETDSFTGSPAHVRAVCEEIISRNLHKRVSWSCNARADTDLGCLPLMKKAGCRMLMVGFEFGTNEQLDAVRKGITVEQSKEFAETARRLGFVIHGCFMIGAPGETRESAQETVEFAKSLPLDTVQISGLVPYPGSQFYRWAKEHGYITAADWTEWVDEQHEQVTLLSYPGISKAEIDAYIDRGLREFYLRPKQMLRMATAVRSRADIMRKVYGIRSFVDYFVKKKGRKKGKRAA